MNNQLIPKLVRDKNGNVVTRWVKPDGGISESMAKLPMMQSLSGTITTGGERDLTGESPKDIDEELRLAQNARIDCYWDIEDYEAYLSRYEEASPAARYGMERALAYKREKHDEAQERLPALNAQIAELEDEFDRRGGWTRFFLVTNQNGHIHKDRSCRTTNRNTQYSWLTRYSGMDEDEIVREAGEKACTVCYPTAPVEWRERPYNLYSDEERAAMEAAKAEKEAAQREAESKAIYAPDGGPLVLNKRDGWPGDVLKTQCAAEIRAVSGLYDTLLYRGMPSPATNGNGHPWEKVWLDDARIIARAVAHKTGESFEEVCERFIEKAHAKHRREVGEDSDFVLVIPSEPSYTDPGPRR